MKSLMRFDPFLAARGTEEFWVPAVLAAAGSGVSYANQKNAQNRQQASEVQAIQNQEKLQQQGRGQVNQLTRNIAANTPDQLAAKATGDYVSTLRKNAAGAGNGGKGSNASILFGAPTSALPSSSVGGSRFKSDSANAQNETSQFGNELASEMGNIDAATRQRENEGLAMNSEATNLNLLGAQSYTQNFADQLRAATAGTQNPWLSLLSGVLSGSGSTMSKNYKGPNSTGKVPPGTMQTAEFGSYQAPPQQPAGAYA